MEDQGTVTVKFPRKTDTKSGWTIDSSFIARVRHSIPPDEDEWIPGHEEVQAVLLALECIPAGIFTQPKQEQGEPVAWIPKEWKLVPRQATDEMLEAMDECSIEGYDERLYAGHAASVYMAAVDAAPATPQRTWVHLTNQEHDEIAIECGCMSADWVFYGAVVERKVREKNT